MADPRAPWLQAIQRLDLRLRPQNMVFNGADPRGVFDQPGLLGPHAGLVDLKAWCDQRIAAGQCLVPWANLAQPLTQQYTAILTQMLAPAAPAAAPTPVVAMTTLLSHLIVHVQTCCAQDLTLSAKLDAAMIAHVNGKFDFFVDDPAPAVPLPVLPAAPVLPGPLPPPVPPPPLAGPPGAVAGVQPRPPQVCSVPCMCIPRCLAHWPDCGLVVDYRYR